MKRYLIIFTSILAIVWITNSQPATEGWSGSFMEQFTLEITLNTGEGQPMGRLVMLDGNMIMQDDLLTDISRKERSLSFNIPAKQTGFTGETGSGGSSLAGKFIFPDGSEHPVTLQKMKEAQLGYSVSDYFTVKLSSTGCSDDAGILYELMTSMHPYLRDPAHIERYERLNQKLESALIRDMTIPELMRTIAPLTDAVSCGHTGLRMPEHYRDALNGGDKIFFPLKLWFIDDKIYVADDQNIGTRITPGAEVLSINDIDAAELVSRMALFVPADEGKMSTKRKLIEDSFADLLALIDPSDEFRVTYRETNLEAGAIVREAKVMAVSYAQAPMAIYNQADPGKGIEFELWEDINTGYLAIPTFGIYNVNQYIVTLDSIFMLMDSLGYENLVIDLRDNNGGHPIFAAQLFSYLSSDPFTYFAGPPSSPEFAPLFETMQPSSVHYSGRCIAIVNERCQSTTGHLISLLDYHDLCEFAGTMPASTYTCNDNSMRFRLPNSRIEANIATTTFTTAVSDEYRQKGLTIDHPVKESVRQKLRHEDPYLSKAKEAISAKKK